MSHSKNDTPIGTAVGATSTPALSLDLDAVEHNIAAMARWCRDSGVDLAPHGKTTMMPDIWDRQLASGAWGITVATAFQAEVARRAGVENVILAGTVFSSRDLGRLLAGPSRVLMWVDSVDAVHAVDDALSTAGGGAPLAVLVEFGSPLGRTGARSLDEFLAVVDAVGRSSHLVLAGVAGYEGALTHDIDATGIDIVDRYLADLLDAVDAIPLERFADRLAAGEDIVLTAGGSIYVDRVAAALAPRHDPTGHSGTRIRVVVRSGAYVAHDHGLYGRLSPFSRGAAATPAPFEPAIELWASVVSRPEPGLLLVGAGRRDVSDDEGLPVVLDVWGLDGSKRSSGGLGSPTVTALNDQHAFVRVEPASTIAVGDLVRLGISHPCTTLDKWRVVAAVRGGTADRTTPPLVVDTLETFF